MNKLITDYETPEVVAQFIGDVSANPDVGVGFESGIAKLVKEHSLAELFPYSNATDLYPIRRLITESSKLRSVLFQPQLIHPLIICDKVNKDVLEGGSCYCIDVENLRGIGIDPDFVLMTAECGYAEQSLIWHSDPKLFEEVEGDFKFTTLGLLAQREVQSGINGLYVAVPVDSPDVMPSGNLPIIAPGVNTYNISTTEDSSGVLIEFGARKAYNQTKGLGARALGPIAA